MEVWGTEPTIVSQFLQQTKTIDWVQSKSGYQQISDGSNAQRFIAIIFEELSGPQKNPHGKEKMGLMLTSIL